MIEEWDEENECFRSFGGCDIDLEHSLFTIAKYEQMTKKAFTDASTMELKDLMFYIRECMCQTEGVSKRAWLSLTSQQKEGIIGYINDPACATTVKSRPNKRGSRKSKKITAELVYASMFSFNMPLECEHWHYNRLITQLAVCADLQSPPQKMSKEEAYRQQAEQNERMRKRFNSKG